MAGGVERHELDEPHLHAVVATVAGQVDNLIVVHATLDHGIDLDRREAGLLGRLDAVEHPLQLVTLGHPMELLAHERVEADVDAP